MTPSPETTVDMGATGHGAWGYRAYREHLAERFPGKVIRKCSLQAGFSCPNLDGTRSWGGCAYCNNAGFVPAPSSGDDLQAQWDRGRAFLRKRYRRVDGFIAYFQAFSNTHAPLERLWELYSPLPGALPECEGVSISTRPDCIDERHLPLLTELSERTFLTVELGLQSDRDDVLARINRGHDTACFFQAVNLLAGRGIELCVHFVLGLPGEGKDAPERMGRLAASLPVQSVKLHNLHIMTGTALEASFKAGRLHAPTETAYLDMAQRFVGELRSDQAVQRIIADAPEGVLLSDPWCRRKQDFLRKLGKARAS